MRLCKSAAKSILNRRCYNVGRAGQECWTGQSRCAAHGQLFFFSSSFAYDLRGAGPVKAGPKVVAGGAKKANGGGGAPAKDSLSEREAALLQKEKELEAREAAIALSAREAEVAREAGCTGVL